MCNCLQGGKNENICKEFVLPDMSDEEVHYIPCGHTLCNCVIINLLTFAVCYCLFVIFCLVKYAHTHIYI